LVDDISQGGLKISFKGVSPSLAEELKSSSHFEVVFTIPQLSQTVSLYCKRLRYNMDQGISMVGIYEGDNDAPLSLMHPVFEQAAEYYA